MYRAHAEEAKRMVRNNQAEQTSPKAIRLLGNLSSMPRAARDDDRPSTSSIVTTHKERTESGGRLIQHKHWHPSLKPDFNRAVLDCLR